ncbi:DUF2378 family protein [Archangium lipolyticum]|uniref:DUF2378 family protein n=1 Tax=Archangium lipolyticum TaxID=2970465 RepID=UPI002149CC5E|nr:DUF2378 family protein [Archangium lipolyticum]
MGDDSGGSHALGSEEELQQLLSYVTPTDTTRGLFLNGVLEVVRQLGDESTVRRCLEESGEKQFLDLFSYPLGTLLRMSYTGARLLSSDSRDFNEVMRQMGYLSARNFADSTMGRVMLRLVVGQPRRLLDTLPMAYRMNTTAGECTVRWTGHTNAVIRFTRDFLPHAYTEGSLQGSFEIAKVPGLTVRARPLARLDTEFELSWA